MQFFNKALLWSLLVAAGFSGLAYVLTAPGINPFLHAPFSDLVTNGIIAGVGIGAGVLFWLYHRWEHNWWKVRLFLAPLAGLLFGSLAYYLSAPDSGHWTLYTFMNLVQPCIPVQRAFTLVGFGTGATLMLLLGAHFFQHRFFASFIMGAAGFFGAGYGLSAAILPYLTTAAWLGSWQTKVLNLVSSYGLTFAVFVGAFVFFVTFLPGHLGENRRRAHF